MDKGNNVLAIFLDLCKAFDVVNHEILIQKLKNIGLVSTVLELFQSYLENRIQYTVIDGHESDRIKVTGGVPQGSVIGPLLFIIYINDICNIKLNGKVILFADDTGLFYSGTIQDIFKKAQEDLDKIFQWTANNKIKLNEKKCTYMLFKVNKPENQDLFINGIKILESDKTKYLGLILDKELKFTDHIEHLISKLHSLSFMLGRTAYLFNGKTKYLIYHANISSILNYLAAFWGQARKQDIEKLQVAQNKLLKILFQKNPRTHTEDLYKELKLLNIDKIIKLDSVKLIHKIKNNNICTGIDIKLNSEIHTYFTRTNQDVHILPKTTNIGRKKITYQAAVWFNELPNNIKKADTYDRFTYLTKKHLLEIE